MPVYGPAVPLISGLRCQKCGVFTAVTEGNAIPICCWGKDYDPSRPYQCVPILEHHTVLCAEVCGERCNCQCHNYRDRRQERGE